MAVLEVLGDSDGAIVLGDPGTGKTTLLRYLVLRHAKALLQGAAMVSKDLGQARLPVIVSAGAFSRAEQRDLGMFVGSYLAESLQCPLDQHSVQRVLVRALQAGRYLVLIDGLDEVSDAAQRAGVVEHITAFVAAQQPRGNRFVCTSRVSGYVSARCLRPSRARGCWRWMIPRSSSFCADTFRRLSAAKRATSRRR